MTDQNPGFLRNDWFGPESFAAAIAGLICISLPYIGWLPNDAVWAILAPALAGSALLPFAGTARRIGVGFVTAFAGFVVVLIAFLIGLAIGHLF
ncbi:Uncharacterised protein [Nocardia otitidiscaviarum]|uniref:Uncharacterized protein n=1 Tax=Nocardia otitidiscaviarum TaxID=1823 RepID=A0A379JI27_9NOCA|nr:hypothetical protein [Nocardia otitidiscaviarum]SUD47911.1 Uncharacterised protein [Nocardia otitidiscaviarum]